MSKILIIEDEEPIRRVLVRILTEEDASFDVHEAVDGKDGLNKLKNNNYDLVLCDIKMPKLDGIEVLEKVKFSKKMLPFIMLTGHGNVSTAVEAMKLGAYDFISKPPDLNRLLNSVRHALETKNLVNENIILKTKVAKRYKMIGNGFTVQVIKYILSNIGKTKLKQKQLSLFH